MRSKFIVAMLGLATFGFGLTACGGDDPVVDNGISPPDHMIGDAPSAGMAAPANAAAAERHDDAALPPPTDGMVWQIDAAPSQALSELAQRTMQLQVTVQDGTLWIADATRTVEITPNKLYPL